MAIVRWAISYARSPDGGGAVKDLAEEMAHRYYEIKKRRELARITLGATPLQPGKWEKCPEHGRLEIVASFTELLADQELRCSQVWQHR